MKFSTVKMTIILFVLLILSSKASSANNENQQSAERYLFCANVTQFYYQNYLKYDPTSPNVLTFKRTRDMFRMAAAATNAYQDSNSFSKANDAALMKVVDILEKEKSENSNLLDAENKDCANTMVNEAVPLLKSISNNKN